jgi:hypothetical protein
VARKVSAMVVVVKTSASWFQSPPAIHGPVSEPKNLNNSESMDELGLVATPLPFCK